MNELGVLWLFFLLQLSSREKPADADGQSGRHVPRHQQVQQLQPEPEQTAAAETSGNMHPFASKHFPAPARYLR